MTQEDVDAICKNFPGATRADPPELISWKVGGKMFACFGGQDNRDGVSVKTPDTETARMLIETTGAIRAKYFHASWVRLPYEATERDELRHRLGVSYDLVRASLKKAERAALAPREAV
ncbi:MAG: MmcQ/YjbR family DNA-binding protein [Paracoccaceae bacterium]|nr:MmcQ/YjbR family DNA-binding protein [Paracoccaceae bacterium]